MGPSADDAAATRPSRSWVVRGSRGLPDASAQMGGSANRHSVLRGSEPQVVHAQAVAPHCDRVPSHGSAKNLPGIGPVRRCADASGRPRSPRRHRRRLTGSLGPCPLTTSSPPTRSRRALGRRRRRRRCGTPCARPADGTASSGAAAPSRPEPRSRDRGLRGVWRCGGRDLRCVLVGPGRLDQVAPDLDVARLGEVPSLRAVARGVLTRDQPAERHVPVRGLEAPPVAHLGHQDEGPDAVDPPIGGEATAANL